MGIGGVGVGLVVGVGVGVGVGVRERIRAAGTEEGAGAAGAVGAVVAVAVVVVVIRKPQTLNPNPLLNPRSKLRPLQNRNSESTIGSSSHPAVREVFGPRAGTTSTSMVVVVPW